MFDLSQSDVLQLTALLVVLLALVWLANWMAARAIRQLEAQERQAIATRFAREAALRKVHGLDKPGSANPIPPNPPETRRRQAPRSGAH